MVGLLQPDPDPDIVGSFTFENSLISWRQRSFDSFGEFLDLFVCEKGPHDLGSSPLWFDEAGQPSDRTAIFGQQDFLSLLNTIHKFRQLPNSFGNFVFLQ